MASASASTPRSLRVVITASRGLGRGLARCLLQRGHHIFLLDIAEKELAHTLTEHLPRHAPNAALRESLRSAGATCDVSQLAQVRAALAGAAKHFEQHAQRGAGFDVLVNMAANTKGFQFQPDKEGEPGLLADSALSEWHKSVNTNLTGAFLVSRESVQYLRSPPAPGGQRTNEKDADEWGSIINISSTRALQSEPNSEGYGATKAGLLGLTHTLASSLSPALIRCNAILPGWIPSGHESIEGDASDARWDDGLTDEDHLQHWSRRAGKVEDLAKTVEWMSSVGFLNGQIIALDGGMTKKMIYAE